MPHRLKIRVQLLHGAEAAELSQDRMHAVNMDALALAARLRALHADLRCTHHPEGSPVIVLQALPDGGIHLNKSGLCCEAVAERLFRPSDN
jgi:hypothetical protein